MQSRLFCWLNTYPMPTSFQWKVISVTPGRVLVVGLVRCAETDYGHADFQSIALKYGSAKGPWGHVAAFPRRGQSLQRPQGPAAQN